MTRLENWPTLLSLYVDSRRNQPFAWGTNDCCMFAADWVLIATGHDIASAFRGSYSGAIRATRIIAEAGGIDKLLEQHAPGLKRIPRALAGRGDLVLREGQHGPTLGLVLGAIDCFVGEDGLVFPVLDESAICWRL